MVQRSQVRKARSDVPTFLIHPRLELEVRVPLSLQVGQNLFDLVLVWALERLRHVGSWDLLGTLGRSKFVTWHQLVLSLLHLPSLILTIFDY